MKRRFKPTDTFYVIYQIVGRGKRVFDRGEELVSLAQLPALFSRAEKWLGERIEIVASAPELPRKLLR